MKIFGLLSQRGLAMAVAVMASGCFHPPLLVAAAGQKGDVKGRDKLALYSGDGPIIRVGLITDAVTVSLSSPSGLNVRRLSIGDRDDGQIADSAVRVEVRKQKRGGSDSVARRQKPEAQKAEASKPGDGEKESSGGYKPRARYTEAAGRPGDIASGQGGSGQVAAFEAGRLLAASEDVLIVSSAGRITKRATGDGDDEKAEAVLRKPQFVRLGNKDYRGEIHLVLNQRGRINVINALPMEEYLRGVVPLELSPGSFPEIEALKAQAIAARSYAMATQGRYGSEGYDLKDTAQSQVYGGLSAEHPVTNRAVEETRGMVAIYFGEDGRAVPIEALYTSTCGGRTENNESIFLGPASPYLRSVECAPDRRIAGQREIASNRAAELLLGAGGLRTARDAALLEVLGFALPARVTAAYLRGLADQAELLRWADRIAALSRRERVRAPRSDATRLPGFARLVASAIYGDARASLLLSPADIDYILSGLASADVATDARADVAMLLREGVLRVPEEGRITSRTAITRAYAIETMGRAILSRAGLSGLTAQTAKLVEGNRLVVSDTGAQAKAQARAETRDAAPAWLEVEKGAWLFRRLGGESYPVASLALVGGERITYHLNAAGRIDFLEADVSERGASSDRFSNLSRWQERVTSDELRRRLARANISLGEIEELRPIEYGASNRVLELEVIGREGRQSLRGFRVRTALGLKESLFVIDTERDERGRATAFVFTGRGWGHGVGMCQTGAYGLAREGYSCIAILQKYYTGVKVQKLY